jgi:ribosomal protein L7/L12
MSRTGRTTNFKAVIDIVSSDLDWKQIVVDIAKEHPQSVVDAAAKQRPGFGWRSHCKKLVLNGRNIEAVHYCRNATGMGLKEAQGAVEAL